MIEIMAKKIVKKSAPEKEVKKATPKKVAAKKTETKKAKFEAHTTSLKEGMKAPDFNGLNQLGNEFGLKDYSGKKIILYFYPKDDTPGCTAEACSLQSSLNILKKEGYEVVGVSPDDVKSHKKFADKFKLEFNLLADTDKKVMKAYDVFGKKMFMGRIFEGVIRTTFVINEKGLIEHVIKAVDTKDHATQIRNL
jgi:peroxiredoxin Q/BCP